MCSSDLKQETLAERLGVSRPHIANTIRLLQLPGDVQQMLTDGRLQAGHGRALLSLGEQNTAAQKSFALRAVAEGLSVRGLEDAVRGFLDVRSGGTTTTKPGGTTTEPGGRSNDVGELEEILSEQLATRVSIQMVKKRGRILTCGATAGFDPKEDLRYIWVRELEILGCNGWTKEDIATLLDYVDTGRIKPVVSHVLPLSQGREAEWLLEQRAIFGKVLLVP